MIRNNFGVICFFCLLFLVFLFPILTHFSTHTTSPNDGPLIIWLINQSSRAILGEGSWYDWPFFYPYRWSATYSDPFLTAGALLGIVKLFTTNPVTQHNIFIIFGTITNFFAFNILARHLWKKEWIATVAATFFCFSLLQLQYIVHLHSYLVAGIPLGLWAVVRYRETEQWQYVVILSLSFLAQALNAPFTAYFFAAVAGTYLVSEGYLQNFLKKPLVQWFLFSSLTLCVWYYIPYVVTAARYDAARTIRDTAHFSVPITKLFSPEICIPVVLIFWLLQKLRSEKIQLSALRKRTWVIIAVIGAVAMLGPVVKVGTHTLKLWDVPIPLPYAIAYYIVPGIQAFRAVSRWSIVLNMGLSLGLGWALSQTKVARGWITSAFLIWLSIMIFLLYRDYPLFKIAYESPPIYAAVAQAPQIVLVELPIEQWDMVPFEKNEDERMLYQLQHGKKLYNGFSGFMPPERSQDIIFHFAHFPDAESLLKLRRAGVELVLIHYDEYEQMNAQNFTYFGVPAISATILMDKVENSVHFEKISCTLSPHDCLYALR